MNKYPFEEYASYQIQKLVTEKYSWLLNELKQNEMDRLIPYFEKEYTAWKEMGISHTNSYELFTAWHPLCKKDLEYLHAIVCLSTEEWNLWVTELRDFLNNFNIQNKEISGSEERLLTIISQTFDYKLKALNSPSDWRVPANLYRNYNDRVKSMIIFAQKLMNALENKFTDNQFLESSIIIDDGDSLKAGKQKISKTPESPVEVSRQELELVRLVLSGLTNKEIAVQLHISVHTVEARLAKLYRRLNIGNRQQLEFHFGINDE